MKNKNLALHFLSLVFFYCTEKYNPPPSSSSNFQKKTIFPHFYNCIKKALNFVGENCLVIAGVIQKNFKASSNIFHYFFNFSLNIEYFAAKNNAIRFFITYETIKTMMSKKVYRNLRY